MKEIETQEEINENRLTLPEMPAVSTDSFPVQYELLTSHETLPAVGPSPVMEPQTSPRRPNIMSQNETKDVGELLAPEAYAALRAALAGRSCPTSQSGTTPRSDKKIDVGSYYSLPPGISQERLNSEGKSPVFKTKAGSYILTPNPHGPMPSPVPIPSPMAAPIGAGGVPRTLVNRPQYRPTTKTPVDPVLFTTPERRISIQPPRPPPQMQLPPPSTFLVQRPGGQYCILGSGNNGGGPSESLSQGRILDSRMLPIDINVAQNHTVPQPKASVVQNQIQTLESMNLKTLPAMSAPITPKLQTGKLVHHQELTQSLVERSSKISEPPSSTKALAAAVENLKTQFQNGDNKLSSDLENAGQGFGNGESFVEEEERREGTHKRKKTSTPASLDDSHIVLYHPGLELLLQAARLAGDELPLVVDAESPFKKHSVNELDKKAVSESQPCSRVVYSSERLGNKYSSVLDNFIGVYPLMDGSFVARCRYKGCYVEIGVFKSAKHAAKAYDRVVLGLKRRKTRTNFPSKDYLSFEVENAKKAFESKCKQSQLIRRGSAWPWARAAQNLLSNDEDDMMSSTCHDYVLNNVPELVQNVAPLTEVLPGKSVFKLLQNVMLRKRDLNGTFDLIQAKIRQLQQRIQSGLSTEEECDCVGQYACVASILATMISMQKEWEKRHERAEGRSGVVGIETCSSLMKTEIEPSLSEPKQQVTSLMFDEKDVHEVKQSVSEGNSRDFPHSLLTPFSSKMLLPSSHSDPFNEDGECDHPTSWMDLPTSEEQHGESSSVGQRNDLNNCPYTESIRWVRLLASSLWPRKRGGGMLWKAYQPLFKSSHHRNSILQLREELFMKSDHLGECQSERSNT